MTDAPKDASAGTGEVAAAISNAVVKLMAEYTGRGPTRARTTLAEEHVTVVLTDTLTKGERSLVRDGKVDQVLSMRYAFQQTMRDELVTAVETLSGRTVTAFMSANHTDPDVAVEFFLTHQPGS